MVSPRPSGPPNPEGKTIVVPKPGTTIERAVSGNTYSIGEKIGEGSFGIVLACTDVWGNDLAAKLLKPTGTYEMVRAKAAKELEKLVDLRHPNITYVYDAFELNNTFYIITERCYGPLTELFRLEGFDGIEWLLPIARCLLQAIDFIHLNDYVHQDIHPGNVFAALAKDEAEDYEEEPDKAGAIQFKLGDLGITKFAGELSEHGTRAQWMLPPEILNPPEFGPVDYGIDIYHAGLVLLQVAYSKELRFSRDNILAGLPREMARSLPMPYSFALEKALRRHTKFRTETAMDLWRDLHVE